MLAVFVDEQNQPDYAKIRRNGGTHVVRSLRDPLTIRAALVADKTAGFGTGVFIARNWYPDLSARAFADAAHNLLKAIDGGTPADPVVTFDIETDDLGFVRDVFRRWVAHRPQRLTDWTMEGHKGGLFEPADVTELVQNVRRFFVPQCYDGTMTQVWDTLAMARDLTAAGIPDARIVPCMDAAHLPVWASGYAFPMGRLP